MWRSSFPGISFCGLPWLSFWLMAFSSATHDIAADGFYMLGLTEEQQAFFIGIRNTFYRVAMLTGQGLLVMLAGLFGGEYRADFLCLEPGVFRIGRYLYRLGLVA